MEDKVIEGGGITSPKGFTAGAVYVGVKSRKTQKQGLPPESLRRNAGERDCPKSEPRI